MKIAIVSDTFPPWRDGITRVLTEIMPAFAKKHELTLIIPDIKGVKNIKGVKIEKIPFGSITLNNYHLARFSFGRVKKILKGQDVVFTHTAMPIGITSIMVAKSLSKPCVAFIHNLETELFIKGVHIGFKNLFKPFVKKLFKFIYNKCSLLLVPSESIADMLSWQGIKTEKRVINLGIDINKFVKGDKRAAKNRLELKTTDFVIGYHGRLGREKDLKTLLRAFMRLRKDFKNVKLLIVGEGVKEIEVLFKDKPNIIFPGKQEDVVPYVQAMDAYVLPSHTETTSLSTLEAMSCEVPVVVTKVGYIKDYVKNNENGFFFEKQNAYELAKKIAYLIKHPDISREIGKKARKTVEEGFDWKITAKKMVEAVEGLGK